MIALINTFDKLPNALGTVVSLHRSRETAERADKELQRSIKRGHGRHSYLPTTIETLCKARWRKGDAVHQSEIIAE